ncbi:MAG: glycosyltransferase family 39 protein [Vicinamibacterales bacterium]
MSRKHQLAAWVVMAVGAALRLGAITAGAPYRIANDEPFVVGMALRIMQSGDFNPHFFHYGQLSIYLHTFVAACRFMAGAIAGEWHSLQRVWIGDYLTAARIVTAAMGTLTVFLVYRVGLRLGTTVALVGAFIMAVLSPHVRESHFALTDTPLTLLVTLSLLLSLRAAEQANVSAVVTAAVVVGLAASVKYNGAVALIMPLTAALALPAGSRLRGLGLACVASAAGFLLTSPYTVIDLPGFLNGFADLSSSYNQGRPFLDAAGNYLKFLRGWFSGPAIVPINTGYVVLAVSVLGLVLIALRRNSSLTRIGACILLVFPVLWFTMLSKQGSLQYGRYLLPIAPVLCLGLATALVTGWVQSARFTAAWRWSLRVPLLAVLVLVSSAAFGWVRDHARPRTEELASAWLVRTVTEGETVGVEAAAILLPHSVRVHAMQRLVDQPAAYYRLHGIKYLVTTAAETDRYFKRPFVNAKELDAFRELVAQTQELATFEPSAKTPGPRISILRIRP